MNDEIAAELQAAFVGSFMQPCIYADSYFEVETSQGTEIVPSDVIGRTVGTAAEAFANYCEGSISDPEECVECKTGYLARMSASGFLDCTDWSAHTTAEDAARYLIDTYGE